MRGGIGVKEGLSGGTGEEGRGGLSGGTGEEGRGGEGND